ncbi:MAG: hypothetical protein KF718_33530, partial [Polyangiaceae bacterium]|nr:hypothetical protein [Polyangiaceae bacterium]
SAPPPAPGPELSALQIPPPARRPYDSLELIHSSELLERSASSMNTDVGVDLEALDETVERSHSPGPVAAVSTPSAASPDAPRPPPPEVPVPSERSGTRQLAEIHAPPSMPLQVIAATPAVGLSLPPGSDAVPDVQQLLRSRTRIGSVVTPVWSAVLLAVVVVAAVVMLLSSTLTALVARRSPERPAPSASQLPSVELEATAAPETPSPAPQSLGGVDLEALAQRPAAERSAEEALTLGDGKRRARELALAQMSERLTGKEPSAEDVAALREAIADGDTAAAALRVMAKLAGPAGPDLLYEAWTRPPRRTPITELAESLVYSKDVLEKASPALRAALVLRVTEDCEKVREHLQTVGEVGDRRSQVPLTRLMRKNGCGDRGREDCFPCLDKRTEVVDALKGARGRAPPRY